MAAAIEGIHAVDCTLHLSPRQVLSLRMFKHVQPLVEALRSSTCTARQLQLIHRCCLADPDFDIELGFRGGHLLLRKLAESEPESDEISEAAAACAMGLMKGFTFPLKAALDDMYPPHPMAFRFATTGLAATHASILLQRSAGDASPSSGGEGAKQHLHEAVAAGAAAGGAGALPSLLSLFPALPPVLVRAIPTSMHRLTSQDDVGQLLWPAAPVLSRWIVAHRHFFAHKRVLEIGAGMGLCGFVIGQAGRLAELEQEERGAGGCGASVPSVQVTLTDFNTLVLQNCLYNARLNEPCLNGEQPLLSKLAPAASSATAGAGAAAAAAASPSSLGRLYSVRRHDWFLYPPPAFPWPGPEEGGVGPVELPPAAATALAALATAAEKVQQAQAELEEDAAAAALVAREQRVAEEEDSYSFSSCCSVSASSSHYCASLRLGSLSKELPLLNRRGQYQVIVGSDIICKVQDALGVIATLQHHLQRPEGMPAAPAPGKAPRKLHDASSWGSEEAAEEVRAALAAGSGLALLSYPPSSVRWGLDHLEELLQKAGFVLHVSTVDPCYLSEGGAEGEGEGKAADAEGAGHEAGAGAGAGEAGSIPSWQQLESHLLRLSKRPAVAGLGVIGGGYEAKLKLCLVAWRI